MKAIIKTFNEKGLSALLWAKKEEDDFRRKSKKIPRIFQTKQLKKFLSTKSEMVDDRQIITGFENYAEEDKKFFSDRVTEALIKNGATKKDFEVLFENDGEQ